MRGNADACEEAFAETQSGISKLAASSSASICDVRQRVSEFVAQSEGEAEMENSTAEEDPLAEQPAKYTTLDFSVFEGLSQPSSQDGPRGLRRALPIQAESPRKRRTISGRAIALALAPPIEMQALALDAPSSPQTSAVAPAAKAKAFAGKGGTNDGVTLSKKQLELISKMEESLQKTMAGLTSEKIWNDKIRKRSLDSAVNRLSNDNTNKLSPLVDQSPKAKEISNGINAFADEVVPRFEVLAGIRQNPFMFVDEAAKQGEWRILLDMSMPLLHNIIIFCAGDAIKTIDQDSW